MDSVLEKITLYDILGYLLPGSVLMLFILYRLDQEGIDLCQNQWSDNQGFIFFVFFLASYLFGIVLSEVMTWIRKKGEWFFKKMREVIKKGDRIIGVRQINQYIQNRDGKRIEEELINQVAPALQKSGIKDEESVICNRIQDGTFKMHYMKYMYGIIQSSERYKRIHNYASAQVMYKNVAGALIVGAGLILYNCDSQDVWLSVGCILASLIFIARCIRFQNKKYNYTVIWFLEKFSTSNETS